MITDSYEVLDVSHLIDEVDVDKMRQTFRVVMNEALDRKRDEYYSTQTFYASKVNRLEYYTVNSSESIANCEELKHLVDLCDELICVEDQAYDFLFFK